MSRTSKALTLIELLISVLLISAILGATWIIYSTGFKVFSNQLSRYDIKDQMSLAFITMTTELRQALSITEATATSVTFTADINSDGVSETIQYTWSGAAGAPLNRISGAETKELVRSINSLAFSYYAANSSTPLVFPVTASEVQMVGVDATASSGDETFQLRTNIYLGTI